MENYKLAIKQKLRIQTTKGLLSLEQLFDLSIDDLDALAVSLDEQYNKSGKKSFLNKSSAKDKTTKLMLDIVVDVLNTKAEDRDIEQTRLENKRHNEKIYAALEDVENSELKGKSKKQLLGMLRD